MVPSQLNGRLGFINPGLTLYPIVSDQNWPWMDGINMYKPSKYTVGGSLLLTLLVGGDWNHGILWLSIYWEFHHPNWRTHIFQRGRYTTNQNIISHHQPYNNHISTITNSIFHLNRTMCMMTTRQFWEMIFAPLDSSSKAFLDHNHRCKI